MVVELLMAMIFLTSDNKAGISEKKNSLALDITFQQGFFCISNLLEAAAEMILGSAETDWLSKIQSICDAFKFSYMPAQPDEFDMEMRAFSHSIVLKIDCLNAPHLAHAPGTPPDA